MSLGIGWLAGLAGWAGWLGWLLGWLGWLAGLAALGWLAGLAGLGWLGWLGWLAWLAGPSPLCLVPFSFLLPPRYKPGHRRVPCLHFTNCGFMLHALA